MVQRAAAVPPPFFCVPLLSLLILMKMRDTLRTTHSRRFWRCCGFRLCNMPRSVQHVQVYFEMPRLAGSPSRAAGSGRRLQQARAKVSGTVVTGSNRDGQPLRTRQLFDRRAPWLRAPVPAAPVPSHHTYHPHERSSVCWGHAGTVWPEGFMP